LSETDDVGTALQRSAKLRKKETENRLGGGHRWAI
jgi:hypothetical protein